MNQFCTFGKGVTKSLIKVEPSPFRKKIYYDSIHYIAPIGSPRIFIVKNAE